MRPHLLVQKLLNMKLLSSVILCIFDYPPCRLHYVRKIESCHVICTNTRAPKGTVLAPFLSSLYTADCRSTGESYPLVKFADDTELVGKISDNEDAPYHNQTENFAN